MACASFIWRATAMASLTLGHVAVLTGSFACLKCIMGTDRKRQEAGCKCAYREGPLTLNTAVGPLNKTLLQDWICNSC